MGIIYKATNLITGKCYIGQTVNFEKRKYEHLYSSINNKDNIYFHNTIRKYGIDNFKWEVVCECSSKEELNVKEKYYIKELNTKAPNGYNLTDGGEGVGKYNYGKTYDEIYGVDISRKLKIERAEQKSLQLKNKTYDEIYGVEISKKLKCEQSNFMKNNNPMHSNKINFSGMYNPNAKNYKIISPDGEEFYIRGLKNFCKEHKLNPNYLSKIASGKIDNYKGWVCSYYDIYGLSQVNVELTSRCNKNCWCCGRRERERKYGDQNYGDIDFELLQIISKQLPDNCIVAIHDNGEPLMYPRLKDAIKIFNKNIVYTVSNGKLLFEKANELINNIDIISVSIIENDDPVEKEYQFEILKKFLELKGDRKPNVILRFVGNVDEEPYKIFNCKHANRTLHLPKGSIGYKNTPVMPEHGICQDLLTRLAIDRFGNVSLCVRFDPEGELILGNLKEKSLIELWNSGKRLSILRKHMEGKRDDLSYCGKKCHYFGVPTAD